MRNFIKYLCITLAILLVGGGCGVIIGANVVDLDYSASEYVEYGEQQKQEGLEEGYKNGQQAGYNDGYNDGQNVGYENGYYAGEDVGYDNGFENGYDVGFEEGLENGYLDDIFDSLMFEDASFKKISDSRVLITSNDCLYSLSSNGEFKTIDNLNRYPISFSRGYKILENGDVFFAGYSTQGGLYLYKYDTETLICLDDETYGLSFSYFAVLKDGSYVISCSSGAGYSDTVLVVSSDYSSVKTYDGYYYVSFIEYSGNSALFKARSTISDSYVFLLYNLEMKEFSVITGTPSSNSYDWNCSLDNGDILMSTYGAGGLYLFDCSEMSIVLLDSSLTYCDNFFKTSNNKVLCASRYDGLSIYDIETQNIKQLSSQGGFTYFEEDENGVIIATSETSSIKYYYDFATESFSRL